MKLIILAAGKGTRFHPVTKEIPKGLLPLGEKKLLEYVLDPYLSYVSDLIFIINDELGYQIKDFFQDSYKGHSVFYEIQKSTDQKGNYFALSLAKKHVEQEELFCVCNCDDLVLEEDVKNAVTSDSPGIGVSFTKMPWYYLGIDFIDGYISGFRRHEKEQGLVAEDYFSNGFHILTPQIFNFIPVSTKDGELGLPQTLFQNLDMYPLKAYVFHIWQAVNNPEELVLANDFIRLIENK